MLTKLSVLFLILFIALPCLAQQPRIDSIAVDEDKGELVLHGNFQNSSSAIVLVDSVSLQITLTSDTLIRATIQLRGKGSCGWIQVVVNGFQGNRKLLTYLHIYIFDSADHIYSDGGEEYFVEADTLHIRSDFSSFARNKDQYFPTSRLSRFHKIAGGRDGNRGYTYLGPTYDTSGILTGNLLYSEIYKQFYYLLPLPSGSSQEVDFTFDNSFSVITHNEDNICCVHPCNGSCLHWGTIAITDFPPVSTTVEEIQQIPNILQAHLSSNPVAGNAEVIATLQNAKNVQIETIDILGHIISSDERMLEAGPNKLPINSSVLLSGIYICRLQAGGEVVSVRFVKESN